MAVFGLGITELVILLVLFAPVVSIVYLVKKATGDGSQLVRCPFCAEAVRAEAIKCKHCGSDLRPAQKQTP